MAKNVEHYIEILRHPNKNARGLTRWWWYGCRVEPAEIERELKLMRDAGIGGVELQMMFVMEPDDAQSGRRNLPFLSPDF